VLYTSLNFKIYVTVFDPASYRLESTMPLFSNNTLVPLFLVPVRTAQQSRTRSLSLAQFCTVLPTLRLSHEFGLVFFVYLRVFLKTCGLLVFGLVLIKFCLFFLACFFRFLYCGLLFFQNLWPFCSYNLLQNETWACFCVNLLILGLLVRI